MEIIRVSYELVEFCRVVIPKVFVSNQSRVVGSFEQRLLFINSCAGVFQISSICALCTLKKQYLHHCCYLPHFFFKLFDGLYATLCLTLIKASNINISFPGKDFRCSL